MDEAPRQAHEEEDTHPGFDGLAARDRVITEFLLDLGQSLHWSNIPAPTLEEHLRKVAAALGSRAEVMVQQGFLVVETRRVHLRRMDFDTHWNLTRTQALVDLCGAMERGERSLAAGRAELAHIMVPAEPYPRWLSILAHGVYGGAVAVRVGGGALEGAAGALIGCFAALIRFGSLRYQRVDLQKSFIAAVVGCLLAFVLALVLPPFSVGKAVFGGMTLLVPAMVLTIGTYELADDALESGVARLAYGLLRLLMLGFGIALASRGWALFAPLPARVIAEPLPWFAVLLVVAVGGVALTICLRARRQDLPWIVAAVVLAFESQELTKLVVGGRGSPIIAALVLGIAACLFARRPGRVPATIVVPGLLQLAPGFLATEAVFNLVSRGGPVADRARIFDVLMTALQLVLGLVLADVLVGRRSGGARPEGHHPPQQPVPSAR